MADSNTVQNDLGKLAEDLATLRADVSKLTDTLAALVRSEGEAVSAVVRERVRAGKAQAEATAAGLLDEGAAAFHEAKARAASLQGDVTAAIERNPIGAVAAALGIGFVVGLLTRGRD